MRSSLHRTALQIKRPNQSIQQRTPQTNQPRTPRNEQTNFLRHSMPPLRKRTMRNRLPSRRHAKRPKNQPNHPQQRQMHRLLDMHHGLPIRRNQNGQTRQSRSKMRFLHRNQRTRMRYQLSKSSISISRGALKWQNTL